MNDIEKRIHKIIQDEVADNVCYFTGEGEKQIVRLLTVQELTALVPSIAIRREHKSVIIRLSVGDIQQELAITDVFLEQTKLPLDWYNPPFDWPKFIKEMIITPKKRPNPTQ